MRKFAMCAAVVGLAAMALAETASFDVVSVKPAPPDAKVSFTNYDPGALTAHGVNLKALIEWAYGVTDVQVSGVSGWMDSKYFDVDARAQGTHTKDEILRMLQPVLTDRFKLALHRETKEMTVQTLTSAGSSAGRHVAQGGPANIKIQGRPGDDKEITLRIVGQSVSPRYLTDYLTGIFGTLVVDRSGIMDSFDFQVDVPMDPNEITTDKRSAVVTALTNAMPKLGLKLDSKKESVEILVIDHAEQPSVN